MAVSLQAAKQLIQQRGVQPPPGANYDEWALQWLQGAIDAGDPEAIKAAGGTVSEGGGEGDLIADWSTAAPPSAWYGQRKPTPGELRRYAKESGQSEDYARFSDRQLADWIGRKWDVAGGFFTNDFGDRVEKPTESGPQSAAAGYATGEKSAGGGGGGGGGGGVPKPVQPSPQAAAYGALEDPLQAALFQLAQSRGIQGQRGITGAQSLAGGGIFTWGNPPPPGEAAPTPPAAPTPAPAAPAPTAPRGSTGPLPRPGTTPNLPGAVTSGAANPWTSWMSTTRGQQVQPAWPTGGAPTPAPGSFDASLLDKYRGRSPVQSWWMK